MWPGESQRLMLKSGISGTPGIIAGTLHKSRLIKISRRSSVGLSPTGNSINSNLKFLSLSQLETKSPPVAQDEGNKSILRTIPGFFTALKSGREAAGLFSGISHQRGKCFMTERESQLCPCSEIQDGTGGFTITPGQKKRSPGTSYVFCCS